LLGKSVFLNCIPAPPSPVVSINNCDGAGAVDELLICNKEDGLVVPIPTWEPLSNIGVPVSPIVLLLVNFTT
jgi:hypothetical protein